MKHKWLIGLVLLLLLGLGAVGCTGEPMPLAPQAEPTSTQPRGEAAGGVEGAVPTPTSRASQAGPSGTTPASATGGTGVTPPPEAQGVVWLSKEDLAQRLSLAPGDIRLVSVEAVDWSDTSLGCPQPGMMYAQVITPGFRVVLEAEGEKYAYHTDREQAIVLCENEGRLIPAPPSPAGTPTIVPSLPRIIREETVTTPVSSALERLIDIAKQDLARRLEITSDAIEVVQIEVAEWPDTSLGCGKPGLARLPVAIPGYRIILSARGREHVYHTGRESGVVYCPKG